MLSLVPIRSSISLYRRSSVHGWYPWYYRYPRFLPQQPRRLIRHWITHDRPQLRLQHLCGPTVYVYPVCHRLQSLLQATPLSLSSHRLESDRKVSSSRVSPTSFPVSSASSSHPVCSVRKTGIGGRDAVSSGSEPTSSLSFTATSVSRKARTGHTESSISSS